MEEDKSKTFSPSKLSTYQNCPKKYQFRYVDRISRKRKTPETVVGVAVHAAFEELHGLVNGGKVPTLAETQATFEAELAKEWDDTVKLRDERFTKDDWRRVGLDCVKNYYDAGFPFDRDKTVAVEKRVGFPIDTEEGEYRIEGFVDRLVLAKDGAFEIHDYKTAKTLPTQADMDEDWQLALYELAIRHDWPDTKEVRLRWHFVRHGKVITSVRDAAAREKLRADAAALIAAIKRDHDFKPVVTALCDWCEYKDLCPEFAHPEKVAALPSEERRKDDGVKLADAFAEIEGRRKKLNGELKAAGIEKERLEKRLAAWAEEHGVVTVAGTDAEVHLTLKDEVELPTKSREPERHDELEKAARALPLWDAVAKLDGHALVEGVKAKRWAGDLLTAAEALLERYGRRVVKTTARLRRRKDADEE
ncbi:MAG: PD-(D/E)XK nuclease family protein [Elusimicrobiota bacterium]|nr:PD-(D/E)XK nuclease family protein [Elusimicrobiota bacterium]